MHSRHWTSIDCHVPFLLSLLSCHTLNDEGLLIISCVLVHISSKSYELPVQPSSCNSQPDIETPLGFCQEKSKRLIIKVTWLILKRFLIGSGEDLSPCIWIKDGNKESQDEQQTLSKTTWSIKSPLNKQKHRRLTKFCLYRSNAFFL